MDIVTLIKVVIYYTLVKQTSTLEPIMVIVLPRSG